ncbi:Heavy metal-associated domain containing protein [Musa troglodytarum]|uniref:Heavy metal-associated domain containing protein n=1 Tax=Musa troglodytarum TaxID=320322 RepID=A0A9E7H3V6_9LILI|nr:Heavy metal-associated domain containing protein [Musa troglodytarum]
MAAVMMRVVVKVGLQGDKDKIKAMKAVSRIAYVDSVSADMEQKKLTVIGFFDPIVVVIKLRKYWHVAVVLIGPANEPGRGRMRQRREKLRRKELLMNRSPSLRRHNKNTRGLILLISQLKLTGNSLDTVWKSKRYPSCLQLTPKR